MLFDAHLHAESLRHSDFEDLRYFGVLGALTVSGDGITPVTADAIRAHWKKLTDSVVKRMRKAGIAGYAAVGVHPRRLPWRGLEALLHDLADFLSKPSVIAIGEIGLDAGTEREEQVLIRQLEYVRELRLPVILRTPWRGRAKMTKRLLTLLKEAEVEPSRVLIDHADAATVKMILACGYVAGLSLATVSVQDAVKLVASLGAERLVLSSAAGEGGGDLFALARAADRMAKLGLSEAVIRRVCGGNAVSFLGLDVGLLKPTGEVPSASSARSDRPFSR